MPRGMHYGVPLGILYHVLKIFSILNWYLNYTQGQYTGCVGNDYGVYFYMSAIDRIRWRMIDDMGNGIMMCGLNGSGKSTLGKALSKRLGYHFIDNERLFFPKTDPGYLFASPRSKEEAFFQMVAGRTDQYVEEWVESVDCPVIRVDGTKDIELNVDYIVGQMELEEE